MSYTAPAGNAVDFSFSGAYTAPAGDAVDFAFSSGTASHDLTVAATLPVLSAAISTEHLAPRDLTVNAVLAPVTSAVELKTIAPRDLTLAAALPGLQPAIQLGWYPVHRLTVAVTLLQPPAASIALEHDDARTYRIAPTLPAPTSTVTLARGNALTLAASMPALQPAIRLAWGVEVPRATLIAAGTSDTRAGYGWGNATPVDAATTLGHNDAPPREPITAVHWQDGDNHNAEPTLPHGNLPQFDTERGSSWDRFDQWMDRNTELPDNYPLPTDLDKWAPWADFVRELDRDRSQDWNYPLPTDEEKSVPFYRVDDWGDKLIWDTRDYTPPRRYEVNFDFSEPYTPPAATALDFSWGAPSPYGNQPIRPTDPGISIAHNVPPVVDVEREVVWGAGSWIRPLPDYITGPGWNNEQEAPAERPPQPAIQEVYIFMPNITLYRLPDGTEFEASNVTWSSDSDSWGWRFTATLKRPQDLALLKPDANGPREIGCEINGHQFTGLVTGYAPTRSFGEQTITISGASLTRWLSDPYAPLRSTYITAPYTARQLAELELANTGFTLQWNTQDWDIPAGAYSYENLAPISAIKRLADTVGAIVQSHPSDKTLIIKPRYPVSPHKWTDPATTLDAILPADLIQQISADYSSRPAYNRAIVAGGANGGVIVTLTRDGTAGDVLAPQITDDLITAQMVGYERARNAIAEGGNWESMNFITVLTQSGQVPGLLLPGHLVEIQDTGETYPVQITGTSVTAQSSDSELTVRQQLTAERSVTHV